MFQIDKMGCSCRHDKSFIFDRQNGYDGYLLLFVTTKAVFVINGITYETEPGTLIIYDRFTPQYYGANGDEYINDWIQFDTTDNLSASGVRFDEPIFIGDSIDISQYFKLLADCYYRTQNMTAVGHLIKAMLSEAFSTDQKRTHSDIAHYRELVELRKQIYSSPERDWCVGNMASQLNISEPYLHLLYKKAFGVTCNQDVINSRIELAQRYLSYSVMTIEEVAYACGYKNVVHFSRQFKQFSGDTPSDWRRSLSTN